ncbi:hypothetical protein [Rothia dentocariosa]|uniref:hypothetical protein n=1 Tax=Rothia dentocariosa TaxID=2047 RepID=UPI00195AB998|nr:hypothetical protein [Rothia dentocariosa]VTY12203.1 Uncharacterised protein [Rothia dentocariosa]
MMTALITCTVLAVILGLGTGLVACCAGIVHHRLARAQSCSSAFEQQLSSATSL